MNCIGLLKTRDGYTHVNEVLKSSNIIFTEATDEKIECMDDHVWHLLNLGFTALRMA